MPIARPSDPRPQISWSDWGDPTYVPAPRAYEGWRFESFASGAAVFRALLQDGPVPTVLRLSDEAETALSLAQPAELASVGQSGCLAIIGYEGTDSDVERRRAQAGAILRAAGARPVTGAGDSWVEGRFQSATPPCRRPARHEAIRDTTVPPAGDTTLATPRYAWPESRRGAGAAERARLEIA